MSVMRTKPNDFTATNLDTANETIEKIRLAMTDPYLRSSSHNMVEALRKIEDALYEQSHTEALEAEANAKKG